jgi:hypothetical protein
MNEILADKKAAILADMISQRDKFRQQLDFCLAKVKSDEDYLADFIPPTKIMIRYKNKVEFMDFVELKEIMNNLSDDVLKTWYLDYGHDCVDISYKAERLEDDDEYAHRCGTLRGQHLASKRSMYEKELNKNIKGLRRKVESLTKTINQIQPPPSPEEDLKISLARLEPGLQAEIMRKAEKLAWSFVQTRQR